MKRETKHAFNFCTSSFSPHSPVGKALRARTWATHRGKLNTTRTKNRGPSGNSRVCEVPPVFQKQKPRLSDLSKAIRRRQDRRQNPGFWLRPGTAQSRANGFTMTPSEAGPARRRPGAAGLKVLSREQAPRKWYAAEQTARLAAQAGPGSDLGGRALSRGGPGRWDEAEPSLEVGATPGPHLPLVAPSVPLSHVARRAALLPPPA